MNSRQGQIFDNHSSPDVSLYFASNNDIDDLCAVINWAYRGKPSTSSSGEYYSGWVGEQHLLVGARITPEELRALIDDEQHNVILVAKIKKNPDSKIVGCFKIASHEKSLQITDEEKDDIAVEFGLNAVDPDYQSRGIGTLMFNGAMVMLTTSCISSPNDLIFFLFQRIAKEYFNAERVYYHILSVKRNQIEWHLRQGFNDTGRFLPFPFGGRFQSKIDPDELKFSVLTKRVE